MFTKSELNIFEYVQDWVLNGCSFDVIEVFPGLLDKRICGGWINLGDHLSQRIVVLLCLAERLLYRGKADELRPLLLAVHQERHLRLRLSLLLVRVLSLCIR